MNTIGNLVRENPENAKFINWSEISCQPLTEAFILEFERYLDWKIICSYQNLTLYVAQRFEKKLDYHLLVKNPKLSPEVRDAYCSNMDWELIQIHQKLDREFLVKHAEHLDKYLLLRHQKLPEDTIIGFLEDDLKSKRVALIHGLLGYILEYQTVSEKFINEIMTIEHSWEIVAPTPTEMQSPVTPTEMQSSVTPTEVQSPWKSNLINFQKLVRYQKLSLEFIQEHIVSDPTLMSEAYRFQALPESYLMGLNYQQLSAQDLESIMLNQQLSLLFLQTVIPPAILEKCYIPLFLKMISSSDRSSDEPHVAKMVNWTALSQTPILNATALQVLINNYADRLNWYLFVRVNNLTETQIEKVSNLGYGIRPYIGAIEWWRILITERTSVDTFTEAFMSRHQSKISWWKFIHPADQPTFFEECLNASTLVDVTERSKNILCYFLDDVVKLSDWSHILRYEVLDEWFIRLFAQYAINIPKYWWKICRYQKLPIAFIQKNMEKMDLRIVLNYQVLPISFLEERAEFFSEDDWDAIAKNQPLTPAFIAQHKNNLSELMLKNNQMLSVSLI